MRRIKIPDEVADGVGDGGVAVFGIVPEAIVQAGFDHQNVSNNVGDNQNETKSSDSPLAHNLRASHSEAKDENQELDQVEQSGRIVVCCQKTAFKTINPIPLYT